MFGPGVESAREWAAFHDEGSDVKTKATGRGWRPWARGAEGGPRGCVIGGYAAAA
jgi:hypothetical protein